MSREGGCRPEEENLDNYRLLKSELTFYSLYLDIDNDGDFDIYSTNISISIEGNLRHNILLQQNQDIASQIFFEEISTDLGIDQGGWGWGATFFDSNNDGLLDLATTNGWYAEDPDQSKIWIQQQDKSFSDQSNSLGFNDFLNGTTLISLDYDRDGDLDMIQSIKGFEGEMVPLRLLENQMPSSEVGNYLVVKPRMNGNNYFSIGAVVTAYTNGVLNTRIIHAGTSFYGQEPAEAFFGLGDNVFVDSLNIIWPGGKVSWWYNIDANQMITLDDSETFETTSTNDIVKSAYNIPVYPNPSNNDLSIALSLENRSDINIILSDVSGRQLLSNRELNALGSVRSQLDVTNVPTGVYFLQLNISGKIYNEKVVVQKE